ncbi:MAG: TerB family tellurite resistance protein [Burkholderiales bacterium]
MLRTIRELFEKPVRESDSGHERRARVAAAALLIEVTRMDAEFSEDERAAVKEAVKAKFNLAQSEADELISAAEREAKDATDYHQFTREINRAFSPEQKIALVERLWQVAYADRSLHKHEDHLVRKVADLLYVPHAHVIAAKNRTRDSQEQQ